MRTVIALTVAVLLASGCSSTKTAQAGARDPRKLGAVGPAISTVWGELRSYQEPVVPRFGRSPIPLDTTRVSDVSATIDVLIDGDGTVRAVALVKGSGYAEVDRGFLVACRTAVFPPMPREFQSGRYVSRQTMTSTTSRGAFAMLPPLPAGDPRTH